MRLINTATFELETFEDINSIPPYAILSHTWGAEEVRYEEFHDLNGQGSKRQGTREEVEEKAGYHKVLKFCNVARARGLRYALVDTCCIDKGSSHELSEAINSMARW